MILRIQQGLLDEGVKASLSQLCRWFEVPRRTVYYQPTKAASKVDEQLAAPIKVNHTGFRGGSTPERIES